jgi:PQQ-dependent dehydrogenase (methanol/ethanol family)
MERRRWALLIVVGCVGLAVADGRGMPRFDMPASGQPTSREAAEWPMHGRNAGETRFSPLTRINVESVKDLGLAWTLPTETTRGLEATPIVAGGILYTGSWSVVFAVDARTGKLLWKWDPEVPRAFASKACCDVVNRGPALHNGKVYVGTLDGRLAALDAESGKPIWQTVTVDQTQNYTITGAPRVIKGKVIIGNGGGEYGVRGYVSAYDAESGTLAWRFYTVPGDPSKGFESPVMEQAAKTWTGEWWKLGGGGTVWDSFSYDPDLDLLYVGTGNGSPWNQRLRSPDGGDNLFLSSILALRPDTGELVWHYQTTPGESWDYTATQHMVLTDLTIGGQPRKVLMQAPKNGFFYVLDRATGALISAAPYTEMNWATGVDLKTGRPIEAPNARYLKPDLIRPGPLGGHNWQPMSFNPHTGLVYIPAQDNAFGYADDQKFTYRPDAWNTGVDFAQARGPAGATRVPPTGFLLAWDPVAQKERWRVSYPHMWNGGTLTTAGNLVFQGTADGRFVAYRADTGERVWDMAVGSPISAAPVTYELDGTQYVAVMAAWGGSLSGANPLGPAVVPGRLLVFALGGKRVIAPLTSTMRPAPSPIPVPAASSEELTLGAVTYTRRCSMCHGAEVVSGGMIPDLRYSAPPVFDRYDEIVLGGSLAASGMPSFKQQLNDAELAAIRTYVLSRRALVK